MRDSASYIVAQLMAVMLLGLGLAIGVVLANIRGVLRLLRRAMAGMATVENSVENPVETKTTTERPGPIEPGPAPQFPTDQPGAPHDISEIDISGMTIPDIGGRP